jgi:hypothetical protein
MVTRVVFDSWLVSAAVLAQKSPPRQPVLERLDPPQRAAVIMAIFGLVLLGLLLVAAVMIGGHWVRRMARHRPRKSAGSEPAAKAENLRLRASLEGLLPESNNGNTVQIDRSSSETKTD